MPQDLWQFLQMPIKCHKILALGHNATNSDKKYSTSTKYPKITIIRGTIRKDKVTSKITTQSKPRYYTLRWMTNTLGEDPIGSLDMLG